MAIIFNELGSFSINTGSYIFIDGADEHIQFVLKGKSDPPLMRFNPDGNIYIKGELIENDKEIVEALRTFLFNEK